MSKMPDFGRYCTPDKYNYFKSFREQFRENGAIHIPSALGADEIALVEQAYNHKLNSSGGGLRQFYENSDTLFLQSVGGHESTPAFIELLRDSCIADIASALFDSPVWFIEEQLFYKEAVDGGGSVRRTPWHQDSSYQPFGGSKNIVVWVSLEPLAADESLEVVKGSHVGPTYNGVVYDPDDDTTPYFSEDEFPRVPDIEADRSQWNIESWPYKVGDVVAFHPNTLHGGATSQPGKPRRTLAFRMFGDDVVRIDYPGVVKRDGGNEENYMGKFEQLEVGVNLSEAMSLTIRPWISEK